MLAIGVIGLVLLSGILLVEILNMPDLRATKICLERIETAVVEVLKKLEGPK